MRSILIVDQDFNNNQSSDYNLVLKLSEDGISYLLSHKKDAHIAVLFDQGFSHNLQNSLEELLAADPLLSKNYNSVKCVVGTQDFNFIPQDFAQIQIHPALCSMHDWVSSHSLQKFTTTFSFPQEIQQLLPKDSQVLPHSELLQALAAKHQQDGLYLNFNSRSADVLWQTQGQIQFQNTFNLNKPSDLEYYLLLLKQELKLADNTPLQLSGFIDQGDAYSDILHKLFKEVYWLKPHESLRKAMVLEQMPAHYYVGLLALNL